MSLYQQGAMAPVSRNMTVHGIRDFSTGASHYYRRGMVMGGSGVTNWIVQFTMDTLHIILLVGGMFTVMRILL